MAWSTPKEDWSEVDGVTAEDLIAIGANLVYLKATLDGLAGTQLSSIPEANLTASGITANFVAGVAMGFGDVCRLDSATGKMHFVDADDITTMAGIAMCIEPSLAFNTQGKFMLMGFARKDAWGFAVNGLVYCSTVATSTNTFTQVAPSGSNDVVQVIGKATASNIIYFNPQLVQVELV